MERPSRRRFAVFHLRLAVRRDLGELVDRLFERLLRKGATHARTTCHYDARKKIKKISPQTNSIQHKRRQMVTWTKTYPLVQAEPKLVKRGVVDIVTDHRKAKNK